MTQPTEPRIIICRPGQFPLRRILPCPNCKQRRRFALLDAAWYGQTLTCCACGDSYGEEGRLPRPFRRGWRTHEIARAKRIWNEAGKYSTTDWRTWLRRQLGPPTADTAGAQTA